MSGWVTVLLHLACVLSAAVTLDDLLRQQAAIRHGRTPPPMAQVWRDLVRLLRKPAIRPAGATAVFGAAPAAALGTALVAALLVPSFTSGMASAPLADLLVVAGLLAASRVVLALAGLDAGCAAMPAAPARLAAAPLLLLGGLVVAMLTGATNLDPAALRDALPPRPVSVLGGLLAGMALLPALTSEGAAPPVFSGRDLALVMLAGQLRRVAALSVVAAVALPIGLAAPGAAPDAWLVGFIGWSVKLLGLALLAQGLARHRATLPAVTLLALIGAVLLEAQPAP